MFKQLKEGGVMSTFVMGGIGPLDVSSGIYLLLILFASLFVISACAGIAHLKIGNSNQTIGCFGTEGEYPVGAEATLPDSLCLSVVEARESRK